MSSQEAFGGDWTQDKLQRLEAYLGQYMKILSKQEWAETVYVDAFAGTGVIPAKSGAPAEQVRLFDTIDEPDVARFITGSARVALTIEPPFMRYLFVERDAQKVEELRVLKGEFPARAAHMQIVQADANEFLIDWAGHISKKTRAVAFLDPCGMQVEWKLLEALGNTKAVDLWLLVPIGMGVNRLLPKHGLPPKAWQDRLTAFFGTDEWLEMSYQEVSGGGLFDDEPAEASIHQKAIDFDRLTAYFVSRLETIFPYVAKKPLIQRNSRSSPMFILCFASANKTALTIANYLLTKKPRR